MGAESFDRVHERERDRRRREAQEAAQRRLVNRAQRIADQVVSHILEHYEPTAIYQAGSLVDSDRFTEISDIDIAVRGLEPGDIEDIADWAEEKSKFPIDLIDLDRAEAVHVESVESQGRRVHPA